ncbi:MAG: 4-(cytidine 5'-diphospho)-2-C-methyl-D-erythritol kinase [Alphaproteobacteria bacterium]
MQTLSALAPAKVNLNLHIVGKRGDGYHLLDSLVVFSNFGDELSICPHSEARYTIADIYGQNLTMDEDNLVVKAHKLLEEHIGQKLDAAIHLKKNLPIAAGIGGGSSDAATTLKLLNDFFALNISQSKLMELGLSLGADVPVCIHGKSCFMSGIGEAIDAIDFLPPLFIGLIKPKAGVSTKEIFKTLQPPYSQGLSHSKSFDITSLSDLLKNSHNDLQKYAILQVKEIQHILEYLKGIYTNFPQAFIHSQMSGSGSTCYIISDDNQAIEQAFMGLSHHDYWMKSGEIL